MTDLRKAKDFLSVQLSQPFWQKLRQSESVKKGKDDMTEHHSAQEIKDFVHELETAEKTPTNEMTTIKKAQQQGKPKNT